MSRKPPFVTTLTHGRELLNDHRLKLAAKAVHDPEALTWNVAFRDGSGNVLHVAEFLTEAKAKKFIAALKQKKPKKRN